MKEIVWELIGWIGLVIWLSVLAISIAYHFLHKPGNYRIKK